MIQIDDAHQLFDKTDMTYREFETSFGMIRYDALLLMQNLPAEFAETALLEVQISELLKNAMEHGNKYDSDKIVRTWSRFDGAEFRLIVEDEGAGFHDIERWNEWARIRQECIRLKNTEKLLLYLGYQPQGTAYYGRNDGIGGVSLFAAESYWNCGIVFSSKRNCVAVSRIFPADFCDGGAEEELQ